MPRRAEGWDRLNAHIGITQEGACILVNDPLDWIWHAQGLSRATIGVEIEGNFCGLDGDLRTLWKGGGGPHSLNPSMMMGLEKAFIWIDDWFAMAGVRWDFVHGHRQSAKSRIADPGEEIWKAVAVPWMDRLGAMDGGPSFKRGEGRTIPREWKAGYPGRYWG
jgi:hypothetical protein